MHEETEKKSLNPLGAVNKRELFHKAMIEVNEDTAEEARRIAIEANPPYYVETYRGNAVEFNYNPETNKYEPKFIPLAKSDADVCLEKSYMLQGKMELLIGYDHNRLNADGSDWEEPKSKSWEEIWKDIFDYDMEMMLREMEEESMQALRNEVYWDEYDEKWDEKWDQMDDKDRLWMED